MKYLWFQILLKDNKFLLAQGVFRKNKLVTQSGIRVDSKDTGVGNKT